MSILLKAAFWLACLVVTALSLTPVDYLPPQIFDIWDKAQHAMAFLTLGLLGFVAYPDQPRARLAFGLITFGAGIEVAQASTGWRYGDLADLLADAIGIAVAWIAHHWLTGHWISAKSDRQ